MDEDKIMISRVEAAASKAGCKVVKSVRIEALRAAWSHPDVEDIIVHTHGCRSGSGIEIQYIFRGAGPLHRDVHRKYMKLEDIFDPTIGNGKSLKVACCYPYSNVDRYSDEYSNQSGAFVHSFFREVTANTDDIVDRNNARNRIIHYLNSKLSQP